MPPPGDPRARFTTAGLPSVSPGASHMPHPRVRDTRSARAPSRSSLPAAALPAVPRPFSDVWLPSRAGAPRPAPDPRRVGALRETLVRQQTYLRTRAWVTDVGDDQLRGSSHAALLACGSLTPSPGRHPLRTRFTGSLPASSNGGITGSSARRRLRPARHQQRSTPRGGASAAASTRSPTRSRAPPNSLRFMPVRRRNARMCREATPASSTAPRPLFNRPGDLAV